VSEGYKSPILKISDTRFCRDFGEERVHGGPYEFDVWKERQREYLREAETRRLARAGRPGWTSYLGDYRRLLSGFVGRILRLGEYAASPLAALPTSGEVVPSGAGLVEAVFEERTRSVRSSSVIEFHREGEGYVIREVDLGTGNHILYLNTEEPEWAAWIWEQKTRR
jgi:hypothetical protein